MRILSCIFCVVILFPLISIAQHGWQAGIKGGISVPKLRAPSTTISSYSDGFQTVVGPQAGLIAEYRFNSVFSIQSEFNYSTQGGKKNGDQRIRTSDFKAYVPAGLTLPEYLYGNFSNKISLVYLELPLMAKFSFPISNKYRLAIYGGPYVGYLIKAEGEAGGKSKIYTDPQKTTQLTYNGFNLGEVDFTRKEDIVDQLSKDNCGLQGGSSIEYTTGRINYFFALGGNYGFKRVQKDPNFGNNKTGGLTVSVGLTTRL